MSLWLGFIPCLCLEQELGEKIAVKLCRLELNSKNKDRWGREIQIMKKWVLITHVCSQSTVHFLLWKPWLNCFALSLLQAEPRERCSGQRSPRRVELYCFKRLTSIGNGVLLKRRPTQGIKWVFYKDPKQCVVFSNIALLSFISFYLGVE